MAATLVKHNDTPPFADHKDLHKVIDTTQLGDVPWQCLSDDVPSWMDDEYEVWYRDPRIMAHNMLANPTYKDEIDYTPFCEYDASDDTRRWKDFMSGDWAWQQADKILKDPDTHRSAFVPIILGSDKTTVSVGTGNNQYYPLYASIGNVHNNIRCAHRDVLVVIGFLAIPKTSKNHAKEEAFRMFRCQLFHRSLSAILTSLKPAMTKYEVLCCGDGHFRRIIYGLGPYIADYEEQVVLSCIVRNWCPKFLAIRTNLDAGGIYCCREHTDLMVHEVHPDVLWDEYGIISDLIPFMNDFPRADIHELLSFDLLHQLIKGAFKDHLVDWVVKIAAVASFSGLRRFPEGCGFKQWTGDDSKVLMKVFLPAIEGHVPQDMVRTFRALLEFCYLVRRNIITEDTLNQIEDVLAWFHRYREIFKTSGVADTFSLPRQHSMVHYIDMIRLFGASNGLCSSITESKHIKAVKNPWRWSSKNNALGQMLLTNQRLDKLAASRVDFAMQGMLVARMVPVLAKEVDVPHLRCLIRHFLFSQLFPKDPRNPEDVPAATCPRHEGKLCVFNSAATTFYAPSDPSGIGGMRREHIRTCPYWRNIYARNDCVFIHTDSDLEGIVVCFFSFKFKKKVYPCALIHWFDKVSDCTDEDTGMWMVRPSFHDDDSQHLAVIHIESIYRASHLIPVYGSDFIPHSLKFYHSYDDFRTFYIAF
ncbi:uncharacterized protein HD556DRAFT_1432311 [Suillus plorans]|uniref:Uncharacterized protein n=1 Tax=Suillus plorans TaxID=116603 RepID=A0A9P7AQK9_9AGAM|nr:uncharacterized protein HD556DRAFT_1432311 [Suillus plorans]KAG1793319.1 hypothetical protein HD556DRAFT_1432311 [Suillus plorans]